jgi:ribosomal protein S18 acetylase RimI-like enzyme
MKFRLQKATKEDAVMIAEISQLTFYETFAADNSKENMEKFLTQQFTKGKLIMEVMEPQNTFMLAYNGEEVAGYLKLREGKHPQKIGTAPALEIARLYAMRTYIGKGVGQLLMQTSIDIAAERKKEWVWLGVWEKNHRAIEFYKKWGFEKFDEQDFVLGDDVQLDWLMRRAL